MTFTSADLRRFGLREQNGKAVRVETQKPRARRFTGKVAQYKAWLREMEQGPGVFIPTKTVSEANNRDGRWCKAGRAHHQRVAAHLAMLASRLPRTLPATAKLTRHAMKLLDDDNLCSALKAVRDGVADAFGTTDGPESRLRFEYAQEKSKHYGVRVEVTHA